MTVTWADSTRNAMLEAWETDIGASAIFRIYTGAPPLHVADAQTGTKLAEFTLAADWATAASGGVKGLANLPLSTTGLADGNAGHYAIYASNGTTCKERGTVAAAGADAIIDNIAIATGQTVKVTGFQKTMPGA